MKRFLLIIGILLSFQALAATTEKTVSKTAIASVISECRYYPGAELVRLGRIPTAALKGVIRLAALDDPEAKEALRIMKGIHGFTVLDYEDCSSSDRFLITRKLERALSGSEMLMEASDGGEKMRIYGVVDEKTDRVRDFVLYAPSSCSLICIFGSISIDAIASIASND